MAHKKKAHMKEKHEHHHKEMEHMKHHKEHGKMAQKAKVGHKGK